MALHGEHDLSSARGCRQRLALGGPVMLGRAGAWSARREAGVRWIAVQVRPAPRWCGAATAEDAGQAVSGGEESADTDAASGAPAAAAANAARDPTARVPQFADAARGSTMDAADDHARLRVKGGGRTGAASAAKGGTQGA